jgi:hypothetical protein
MLHGLILKVGPVNLCVNLVFLDPALWVAKTTFLWWVWCDLTFTIGSSRSLFNTLTGTY